MPKRLNKKKACFEFMRSNGSINTWQAIQLFNATRLSGYAWTWRHREGHDVESVDKLNPSTGSRYTEYIYHPPLNDAVGVKP